MKKVFLDANIIIRLIVKDNASQHDRAKVLLQQIENGEKKGILSLLVISEIIWIVEKYYDVSRSIFLPYLKKLLALKYIEIFETSTSIILETFSLMEKNTVDFTDAYLFINKGDCEIVSFDNDFQKLLHEKNKN